jgi:hypothetical protein
MRFIYNVRRSVGIERKNSGQCDYGNGMFEYIQITTILILGFEIVLKSYLKRSKWKPRNGYKSGLSSLADSAAIIDAQRLHQRKQFIGVARSRLVTRSVSRPRQQARTISLNARVRK